MPPRSQARLRTPSSAPRVGPQAGPQGPQQGPPAMQGPAPGQGGPARQPRGNAAAQEQLGTADPVAAPAQQQDPRAQTIEAYGRRLWDVVGELMLDESPAKAGKARAVLGQAVDVQFALQMGQTVELDLLPRIPPGDQGRPPTGAFPPQWVQPARILLEMAGGSGASPKFQPDGGELDAPTDLWAAGQVETPSPWAGDLEKLKRVGREPADYGVNRYQTQSNNLASPEATCNGTSLAMVLERLGYTRDDLVRAIETKLKRAQLERQLRAQRLPQAEIQRQMAEFDPSCVMLANDAWKNRVLQYLRGENERGSGYQRPRGATQRDSQLSAWAGSFREDAGMDDLALFLMDMLNIERTTVNSGTNPERIVGAVHDGSGTHAGAKPTTERIDAGLGWARAKARLQEALDGGGAAMLSIRHKGRGQSGTHIVAVQSVDAGGITVDDPFGRARDDYRGNERGDAYALPGRTRSDSGLKNQTQPSADDWKMSAPVTREETRGEYSYWTDDMVRSSLNYVMLFRRGAAAAAPTATGGGAPTAGGGATAGR